MEPLVKNFHETIYVFVIFQSCIYISIQASIVIAHFYFSYGYLSFNPVVGVLFVVYGFVLNWDFFSRMLGKVDCLLFYLLAMVRFVNHLSCTYTNVLRNLGSFLLITDNSLLWWNNCFIKVVCYQVVAIIPGML